MCDHDNVESIVMMPVQMSDGNKRYTCSNCNECIIKNVYNDIEFNRAYQRYHGLCNNHTLELLPTYINTDGNKCCNWCGYVL